MTAENIRFTLGHGETYPFDGTNKFWEESSEQPAESRNWMHVAARGVISSISDRRGIKRGFERSEWEEVDRVKLIDDLEAIIAKHDASNLEAGKAIVDHLYPFATNEFDQVDADVMDELHETINAIIAGAKARKA